MSVDGFNYDNILIKMLNRLGDVLILSLTFVLFSLPIVTIGASITALYYTAMKSLTLEDGYIFKFFVKSFKENLKQSTIIWLISLGVLTILGVDVWFWVNQWKRFGTEAARPMIVVSVVLLSLAVMIVLYVFPLQAKFENKIKIQFRNAFLLAIKYFPTTILMVAILAVVAWMFYYNIILAIIGFGFIGFGIMGFVFGHLMLKCFKPYLEIGKEDEEKDPDDWKLEDEEESEELDEEPEEDIDDEDSDTDDDGDADVDAMDDESLEDTENIEE